MNVLPILAFFAIPCLVTAQSLSILPGEQVVPVTGRMMRLEFVADAGKFYQIESSEDLNLWQSEGYAFQGSGSRMSVLVSNRNLSRLFYRVRNNATPSDIAPFSPYGPLTAVGVPGPQGPSGTPGPQGIQGIQGPIGAPPEAREIISPPILPLTLQKQLSERQAGAPRSFRLRYLMLGDSYALDLSDELAASVAPVRERGFGNTMTLAGGAVLNSGRFDLAPNGNVWFLSGNNQTVQIGSGSSAEMECYRVKVFFSTTAGGGTFSLETNTKGAGWVEVPGATSASPISTESGGGVGAGVFTYSFPATELRKVRAKWISGAVRIIGFVLSDISDELGANRGGCGFFNLALGNTNVADGRFTPQEVWNVILRDLQPDFCTYKSDDGEHAAAFAEYYQKIQTAYPMDWVMISRHPSNAASYAGQGPPANSGNELLPMDVQLRDFAISKGHLFVNGRRMFPSLDTMIQMNMTTDGNPHLTTTGDDYQQQLVMNLLSSALQPSSNLPGGKAIDFENGARYRNASLGIIGKSGPQMVLDMLGSTNSGANFRPFFGVSKIDDIGTTGFHQGQFNRCFAVLDSEGALLFSNAFSGWQQGLPTSWTRQSSGMIELFAGDRTTSSPLALSGTSSHTGDVVSIFRNATSASPGIRSAGIKPDGAADFGRLKANLPTYASDTAADADSSLLSGQFYKLNGNRAVYQKP